jgi:hypothetical protein
MARIGDVVLIDYPADASGPHSINCYFVEVEEAVALGADGKKFKIEPQRLLYSLQWKHNGHATGFSLAARARSAALVRFRRCYAVRCAG